MILTHESEAQEDQFDGKKRRPKISWYYPFNWCPLQSPLISRPTVADYFPHSFFLLETGSVIFSGSRPPSIDL
jgi:hypothetical protein